MRLGVFTRIYKCPYFPAWFDAMRFQTDQDYELYVDLRTAIEESDFVLFSDIDDVPYTNFVREARMFGISHDVTGFSMTFIDHYGRKKKGYFGKPGVDLDRYNVYGLTNTIYRADLLKEIVNNLGIKLNDWNMAREAKRLGADMAFCHVPAVRYRRYGQDTSKLTKLGNRYVWDMR